MALTTNPKVWKIMISIFVVLTIFFSIFFYFKTISLVILFAGVLIFITNKISLFFQKMGKSLHIPDFFKKTFTFLIVGLFLYILISGVYNSITSVNELIADTEDESIISLYYAKYESYIPSFNKKKILDISTIENIQTYVLGFFTNIFTNTTSYVINGLLLIPLVFYMYFNRRKEINERVLEFIPLKFHKSYQKAMSHIVNEMGDFINAKFTESFIIFIICAVGFFISGIKGWLFLALFAGVLNIVPYIGPIIGAVPAVVISLLTSPMQALFVLVTILVAQAVDNFYLIPFMISSKVKVDSLLSIILILIGAKLFGPIGMILAVPIYLIYRIVISVSYNELIKVYRDYKEYAFSSKHVYKE